MRNKNGIAGLRELSEDCGGGILVEIGSFSGESAVVFAESGRFSRICCVDPWDAIVDIPERFRESYSEIDMVEVEMTFDRRTTSYSVIEKFKMNSSEAFDLLDFPVNMVYIDAIHDYECVVNDIMLWSARIVNGGWICGHDYSEKFPDVIKAVNESLGIPKVYRDNSWAIRL